MNPVDFIIAYESGDLSEDEVIEGFQTLFDSGLIYGLQGSYQRTGQMLLDAGLVTVEGYDPDPYPSPKVRFVGLGASAS